jgi:hypothetical protein
VDRERVDAILELGRQSRIDHAVTFDPALPPEGFRYNMNAEVGLPARPVAGMAFVPVRFVDHLQAFGGESFGQLVRDEVVDAHKAHYARRCRRVNRRREGKNATGRPAKLAPGKPQRA